MNLLRLKIWMAILAVFLAATAQAAPARNWKEKAEVALLNTTGNSRETTYSLKNIFNYKKGPYDLESAASALVSSNRDVTTAEEYSAGEELKRTLTGPNYAYQKFLWERNRFSGVNDRYHISAGLGRRFLDSAVNKLTGEFGGGYLNEDRINLPRNDFPLARAYAKYTRIFGERAELSQDAEYLTDVRDAAGYRLRTESDAILSLANSRNLALKASFVWKRINQPTPGFGKDDTTTSLSLILKI